MRCRNVMLRAAISLAVCGTSTHLSSADVTLELIGSGDFTVQPATVASPTDVFPFQGEPLIVWAEMTNVGTQPLEATGPGGGGGPGHGAFLWCEFPRGLWDPSADPDDPIVETPLGYPGVRLEPGESFPVAIMEVWGIDFTSTHPLYSASIGNVTTFYDVRLSFWDGFDRDPNDPFDLPDLFVPLDRSFTVTVVPDPPSGLVMAIGAALALTRGRVRFPQGGARAQRRRGLMLGW
jgi:hypothetical protein